MNYQQATEYLFSLRGGEVKLGLEGITGLLGLMGDPQRKLRCMHVAGTNGKGSVCAMIASVLQESGFRVGLYTSPHLHSYTERIQVNGREIAKEDAVRLVSGIEPLAKRVKGQQPSFFEITTALAFRYFADNDVDYAVIEAGLGGRLDATNVITPLVSVITNADFDHMQILGDSVAKIAQEKAGIIKPGVPVVTAASGEALGVIEAVCREKACKLVKVSKPNNIALSLPGEHQKVNAATAIAALRLLNEPRITDDAIRQGLKKAKWPGRLELIGNVLLDGAHNLPAIRALKASLPLFKRKRLVLVLGILQDKDYPAMIAEIAPAADEVIITRPDAGRAAPVQLLESEIKKHVQNYAVCDGVASAVAKAKSLARPGGLVLVTGSLYTVGEAREALLGMEVDEWKGLSESSLRVR
jgi:dihydrofolate synthase/folylpolyglutamate synthase